MQVCISRTKYDFKKNIDPILVKVIKKLIQQGQNPFWVKILGASI